MESNQLLKVKLIAAILYQTDEALSEVYQLLEKDFPQLISKGPIFLFRFLIIMNLKWALI